MPNDQPIPYFLPITYTNQKLPADAPGCLFTPFDIAALPDAAVGHAGTQVAITHASNYALGHAHLPCTPYRCVHHIGVYIILVCQPMHTSSARARTRARTLARTHTLEHAAVIAPTLLPELLRTPVRHGTAVRSRARVLQL